MTHKAIAFTEAERTIPVSLAMVPDLPLGPLRAACRASLTLQGYYAVTVDGIKTLYVLTPPYAVRQALREKTLAVGNETGSIRLVLLPFAALAGLLLSFVVVL